MCFKREKAQISSWPNFENFDLNFSKKPNFGIIFDQKWNFWCLLKISVHPQNHDFPVMSTNIFMLKQDEK